MRVAERGIASSLLFLSVIGSDSMTLKLLISASAYLLLIANCIISNDPKFFTLAFFGALTYSLANFFLASAAFFIRALVSEGGFFFLICQLSLRAIA